MRFVAMEESWVLKFVMTLSSSFRLVIAIANLLTLLGLALEELQQALLLVTIAEIRMLREKKFAIKLSLQDVLQTVSLFFLTGSAMGNLPQIVNQSAGMDI